MSRQPFSAAIATVALSFGLMSAASAHRLTVEIDGARSNDGQVAAALYDQAGSWLKTARAGQRTAAASHVTLVFDDLPDGRYAVSAMHDENASQSLDSNPFGMPTEPYGFSRDARGRMGPPSFDDAVIELQGDTTVHIQLR